MDKFCTRTFLFGLKVFHFGIMVILLIIYVNTEHDIKKKNQSTSATVCQIQSTESPST